MIQGERFPCPVSVDQSQGGHSLALLRAGDITVALAAARGDRASMVKVMRSNAHRVVVVRSVPEDGKGKQGPD